MGVTIRPATSQDARDIALVYNQAVTDTTTTFDTEPQTDEQRLEWLTAHGPRHPVVVTVEDDVVVGWGSLSPWSDRPAYDGTAEVSIYVERSSLGRGIGGALADEPERRARELGPARPHRPGLLGEHREPGALEAQGIRASRDAPRGR